VCFEVKCMLCSEESSPTSLWNLLAVGVSQMERCGVKTAFIFSCMRDSYESETQKWPCHSGFSVKLLN